MPISATMPQFRTMQAPTEEYVTPQYVAGLFKLMQDKCAVRERTPEADAACTAAYEAWRAAEARYEEQQIQLGGTALPSYLTAPGVTVPTYPTSPLGGGVLPPTGPTIPSLSGPPPPGGYVPPRRGKRPREPRPPRPNRPPRPPRYRRPARRPRPPRFPRPPRPFKRRPKVEDSGYRFWCMTSKAAGFNCTGSQCVYHHIKVVEQQEAINSHLHYTVTLTCDPCGGQGCQLGGFISCEWLPWRVPAGQTIGAVERNAQIERLKKMKRPWWERYRIGQIIQANPNLTPRQAIIRAPKVEAVNCWCLPPPYFLYPPGRGKCFGPRGNPSTVGLGDMWVYNPTGQDCGELLERSGFSKPAAGW